MTDAERALWRGLREVFPNLHWRKQVPFAPRYTADLCSHRARLTIEVDGGQHDDRRAYDAARTRALNAEGYRILRFWNNDVLTNLDGVLQSIAEQLSSPLVGEDQGGGRRASARQETQNSHANEESPGRQAPAAPHQPPPQRGRL